MGHGRVERTIRTIKDTIVKRFHDDSRNRLRVHLAEFMAADKFA
jgi:hypothetical protein